MSQHSYLGFEPLFVMSEAPDGRAAAGTDVIADESSPLDAALRPSVVFGAGGAAPPPWRNRGEVSDLRSDVADFRERVTRAVGDLGARLARLEGALGVPPQPRTGGGEHPV